MTEFTAAVDPTGDEDDVEVLVFSRPSPGHAWRLVDPQSEPFDVASALPDRQPARHHWEETIVSWGDYVQGWVEEHVAGEFTLTAAQAGPAAPGVRSQRPRREAGRLVHRRTDPRAALMRDDFDLLATVAAADRAARRHRAWAEIRVALARLAELLLRPWN